MPSTKRPNDSQDGTPIANKLARTGNGDFSGAVKKKLSGASRTGQACDRCKVRKIRCDARPGGCSPCLQNNTECKTTDRITGRATSRGYTENVEGENSLLKQHIADLQQQLQEHGIDPHPVPIPTISYASQPTPEQAYTVTENAYSLSSILNAETDPKSPLRGSALPDFQSDQLGDNYLGVSSANGWPLPITGLHHALFGMHLDLKDFVPAGGNERTEALSYQAFHDFAARESSQEAPILPPYQQLRTLCEWFFKSMNPWLPILHKPTFFTMLDRMHQDPTYVTTIGEKVQLHTVVGIMLYQYTTRNAMFHENSFVDHYKYALSFVRQLSRDTSLVAVQSLTLIVSFLRSFPRPGAAWHFSSVVLTKAIEAGLHRSVVAWNPGADTDPHQAEMRKRVFWSLLSCHVMVGAKLGRPLLIKVEDFDVELPKNIHDYLPEEQPSTEWDKCSFVIGTYSFKMMILYMQIYTSLYSVRPTSAEPYEQKVKQMTREIDTWYASKPAELRTPQTNPQQRVFVLYIDHSYQHLRLLLHHPASCRTPTQEMTTRNLDVCLDTCSRLLQIGLEMKELKSLDTTWFNTTIFLAAIFTTLFAYLERRDQITSAEFTNLRNSMDSWLDIMADVGQLLGSGSLLKEALRQIVSSALANISEHLAAKTASAAVATAAIARSPSGQPSTDQHMTYQQSSSYGTAYPSHDTEGTPDTTAGASYLGGNDHLPPQQHSYASQTSFAYPEPAHTTLPTYSSAPVTFDTSGYSNNNNDDIKPDLSAQIAALRHAHSQNTTPTQQTQSAPPQPQPHQHTNPQSTNFYPYPNGTNHNHNHHPSVNPNTGSIAWRQFADSIVMNNLSPHWSANALIALQGQQQQQQVPTSSPSQHNNSHQAVAGGVNGTKASGNDSNNSPIPTTMGLDAAAAAAVAVGQAPGVSGVGTGGFDIGAHPQNWPVMEHFCG